MIQQSSIQQILSHIDAVDIIGSFVKLKKRGVNYLGLCPFHNERTPSFTVSPTKEIFKCFGCGRSGNSISFLMEHEKYTYVEALRWLANRYNIELEETAASPEVIQQQQTSESLFIINHFAQKFFAEQLFETEEGQTIGLSYLKERGFTAAVLQKFGVGYSPEQKDAFAKAATTNQYNTELLQKTGLVVLRNGQLTDNYRGRIIFPVHNTSGKIIGFGARLIKSNDKAPKYINTPENELYVKSKLLYGMYLARHPIDKADECLLVEGYTDVISLHQAGIENVVASGGTSLTIDQLRLVKKYTKNLTIIYDGDSAGIKAALRGLDMALEEGLNVQLVLIPDKEDPDSYVRQLGADAFRQFIAANKKDFIFFQLEVLLQEAGKDATQKAAVVNQVAQTISKIDKAEDFTKQQDYIRQCSQQLKIDEAGFTTLVNKFIRTRLADDKKLPFDEAAVFEENAKKGAASNFEDQTFNLLYKDELQEKEIVRILLEYGNKKWNDDQLIADHILTEFPDEDLIDNKVVMQLINIYKQALANKKAPVEKSYFVYYPDTAISTLAVSVLNSPYEESSRWKSELSQSFGYQKELFQQDYAHFFQTINSDNKEQLMGYLKTQEDKTMDEVSSAINYLKLRKIKRLLLQNQADMEKADPKMMDTLFRTHMLLKQMEIDLTRQLGTVIVK